MAPFCLFPRSDARECGGGEDKGTGPEHGDGRDPERGSAWSTVEVRISGGDSEQPQPKSPALASRCCWCHGMGVLHAALLSCLPSNPPASPVILLPCLSPRYSEVSFLELDKFLEDVRWVVGMSLGSLHSPRALGPCSC